MELNRALRRFAAEEGLPDAIEHRVLLIIEEFFVNFVEHGRVDDPIFRLEVESTPHGLKFMLQDNGPEFNLLEADVADVDGTLDERRIGGYGLHFAKELSHGLAYARQDGRNVVTFDIPMGDWDRREMGGEMDALEI